MSNHANDSVLRELNLLAALDIVKARVDTSATTEIQDWSGAVIGKFYGATVEQPLPDSSDPSGSSTFAGYSMDISIPASAPRVSPEGMAYAQVSAPQLISICSTTRDEAAWTEFVRRYQPLIAGAISRYVRRMGNVSRELVEELIQEVYVKLWANNFYALKTFEISHEPALPSFIKAVAVSVAHEHFRGTRSFKRRREVEKERELESESIDAHNSSSTPEREVLLQEIDRVLRRDSQSPNFERDYKIFWLHYKSGLTAKEISHLPGLGLTVKGIESVLLRVTQQLKKNLVSPVSEKKKKENP
jgi:RNA polymerase sigma factor (sigma-70 family)